MVFLHGEFVSFFTQSLFSIFRQVPYKVAIHFLQTIFDVAFFPPPSPAWRLLKIAWGETSTKKWLKLTGMPFFVAQNEAKFEMIPEQNLGIRNQGKERQLDMPLLQEKCWCTKILRITGSLGNF